MLRWQKSDASVRFFRTHVFFVVAMRLWQICHISMSLMWRTKRSSSQSDTVKNNASTCCPLQKPKGTRDVRRCLILSALTLLVCWMRRRAAFVHKGPTGVWILASWDEVTGSASGCGASVHSYKSPELLMTSSELIPSPRAFSIHHRKRIIGIQAQCNFTFEALGSNQYVVGLICSSKMDTEKSHRQMCDLQFPVRRSHRPLVTHELMIRSAHLNVKQYALCHHL